MKQRKIKATAAEQLKELKKGVSEILPEDELLKKLESSYHADESLIIKFGADPSRPDIHFGHTVVINKLRQLQEFGHEVNFLIGDFTAQIGDPTGRSKVRQQLSQDEVKRNATTYQEQVFKILDPSKTKIVYNSHWLNPIPINRFLEILMTTTVSQLLTREDFSARFEAEQPIFLHEFLYPILQGYDSVVMKADIELGGTDQKFNLLMGRHLQHCFGIPQQALIIMPLLEGLDGIHKMSKSMDNVIALTDSSKDIFGKVMSISDQLMLRYYELLSFKTVDEIHQLKESLASGGIHPMQAKKELAEELVERYHGPGSGRGERIRFEELFSKKSVDSEIAERVALNIQTDDQGRVSLLSLLTDQKFAKSRSDARRLLQQRAVKIDGEVIVEEWFTPERGKELVLRSGKLNLLKFKAN